jgi:hypothetical protein
MLVSYLCGNKIVFEERPTAEVRLAISKQCVSGHLGADSWFRPHLAHMERDLPLRETLRGSILALQPPGIRGMSANMRRLLIGQNDVKLAGQNLNANFHGRSD